MGLMPSVSSTIILGCNADCVDDPISRITPGRGLDKIVNYFEKNWKHFPSAGMCPSSPVTRSSPRTAEARPIRTGTTLSWANRRMLLLHQPGPALSPPA